MHPLHRAFLSRVSLTLALLSPLPLIPVAAAQSASVSQITFTGTTASSSNVADQVDPANTHGYPPDTHFVPLHMNVKNALEALILIDRCTEIEGGSGTYTASEGPYFGEFTSKTMKFDDPTEPCKGDEFNYNFAFYTWTRTATSEPQDFFHVKWVAPSKKPTVTNNTDWLAELIPESETTKAAGTKDAHPTFGLWQQTLHLTTINYQGVTVMETQPYVVDEVCDGDKHCAPDTCWYPNSIAKPYNYLSGGTWPVQDDNIWAFDSVGYGSALVLFYRQEGRVGADGCGSTAIPQQMKIRFDTGDPNFYDYGDVNLLGMMIYRDYVVSYRAGETQRISY